MATWDDVERIALSLPLVEERADGGFDGWRTWKISAFSFSAAARSMIPRSSSCCFAVGAPGS